LAATSPQEHNRRCSQVACSRVYLHDGLAASGSRGCDGVYRPLKRSAEERARQRAAVAATKTALQNAGLPVLATETHIVPVMVGDPDLCKRASDLLLDRHGIYIQPINHPTVANGTERLRITPTPAHDVGLIRQLTDAMVSVWEGLDLPLGNEYRHAEQHAQTVAVGG
jgi:5-aminolevulinate synthase